MARFQARSAFTTTGFTTPQASLVVTYPERRRVISVLMVLGNAGVVSVMATVVLCYVDFEASVETLAQEALWLALAAAATLPVLRGLDACFRSGSLALHNKA